MHTRMNYYHYGVMQPDILGTIFTILLIVLIALAIGRLIGGPRAHHHLRRSLHRSPALDILEERFAKGEITKEEFEEKRRAIIG